MRYLFRQNNQTQYLHSMKLKINITKYYKVMICKSAQSIGEGGGFYFESLSFKFWQGDDNRLNFREKFVLNNNKEWDSMILES